MASYHFQIELIKKVRCSGERLCHQIRERVASEPVIRHSYPTVGWKVKKQYNAFEEPTQPIFARAMHCFRGTQTIFERPAHCFRGPILAFVISGQISLPKFSQRKPLFSKILFQTRVRDKIYFMFISLRAFSQKPHFFNKSSGRRSSSPLVGLQDGATLSLSLHWQASLHSFWQCIKN